MYLSAITRVHDYKNYDFIKHFAKHPEVMQALYQQFGILNLFNPHRPNGSYLLDLSKYEEQIVGKMLGDLARQEGVLNMTEIKFTAPGEACQPVVKEGCDKPEDNDTDAVKKQKINDFIRNKLKKEGIFECTYVCAEDKIKEDLREQLGVKYLDWK